MIFTKYLWYFVVRKNVAFSILFDQHIIIKQFRLFCGLLVHIGQTYKPGLNIY